jgi:hypothetical protein
VLVSNWAIDFVGFSSILIVLVASVYALFGARVSMRVDGAACLAVVFTLVVCACGFLHGTALSIADSAEYLAVARRLLFDGRLDLVVDSHNIPSRYQPWFSWFFLFPFIRLGVPSEFANGVSSLFALVGVLAAGALVRELIPSSPARHSLLVGCGLFLLPAFGYFAGELMTDVPATTLVLLVALLFEREAYRDSVIGACSAGILIGAASALRPLYVILLIPWLWHLGNTKGGRWRRIVRIFVVILPAAAISGASLYLNWSVFGDPLRSGYNLWTGVPYDLPHKVFNLLYVVDNLTVLTRDPAFILVLVGALLPLRISDSQCPVDRERIRRLVFFTVCGVVPVAGVHLLYFYQSIRFFLPLECLLLIFALSKCVALAPRFTAPVVVCLLAATALKSVSVARQQVPFEISNIQRVIAECIPSDGVILSSLHPMVSQEFFLRGTSRLLIPTSRTVELASKVLTWNRVLPPSGIVVTPREHRAPWLLTGGAVEAYEAVAVDNPERVRVLLQGGRRVFLLDSRVSESERIALLSQFVITPACNGVEEITVR